MNFPKSDFQGSEWPYQPSLPLHAPPPRHHEPNDPSNETATDRIRLGHVCLRALHTGGRGLHRQLFNFTTAAARARFQHGRALCGFQCRHMECGPGLQHDGGGHALCGSGATEAGRPATRKLRGQGGRRRGCYLDLRRLQERGHRPDRKLPGLCHEPAGHRQPMGVLGREGRGWRRLPVFRSCGFEVSQIRQRVPGRWDLCRAQPVQGGTRPVVGIRRTGRWRD